MALYAFSQFDNQDIIQFFESRGVIKGRRSRAYVPGDGFGYTILRRLFRRLRNWVQVRTNVKVKTICASDGAKSEWWSWIMASNFEADAASLATVENLIRRRVRQDGYGIAKSSWPYDYTAFCDRSSANEWRGVVKKGELTVLSLRNVALRLKWQRKACCDTSDGYDFHAFWSERSSRLTLFASCIKWWRKKASRA